MKIEANKQYLGIVVDNKDPEHIGKCRVRVFGLMDDTTNLKDEHIPWAFPSSSNSFAGGESGGYGNISIPKLDTVVNIRFIDGDFLKPQWTGIEDINETLRQVLAESYENSQVIAFDEDENLKIIYTQKDGMVIHLKGSTIAINPDSSITVEHKDTSTIIELVGSKITMTANSTVEITATSKVEVNSAEVHVNGNQTKIGAAPSYSAVCAEPLWATIKSLAAMLDVKWPPSPGAAAAAAAAGEVASTSRTVTTSM
jgi:hypothetical protein